MKPLVVGLKSIDDFFSPIPIGGSRVPPSPEVQTVGQAISEGIFLLQSANDDGCIMYLIDK